MVLSLALTQFITAMLVAQKGATMTTDPPVPEGMEWVRRSTAVYRLGISERAISQRVKTGKLLKRGGPRTGQPAEVLVPIQMQDSVLQQYSKVLEQGIEYGKLLQQRDHLLTRLGETERRAQDAEAKLSQAMSKLAQYEVLMSTIAQLIPSHLR